MYLLKWTLHSSSSSFINIVQSVSLETHSCLFLAVRETLLCHLRTLSIYTSEITRYIKRRRLRKPIIIMCFSIWTSFTPSTLYVKKIYIFFSHSLSFNERIKIDDSSILFLTGRTKLMIKNPIIYQNSNKLYFSII